MTHPFQLESLKTKRRERVARRARDAGFRRVAQDGRLLAGRQLLSVGQIYLYDNPAFARTADARPRKALVVGHWVRRQAKTSLCALNRVIKKYDLDMIYIAGPGHAALRWWATRTLKYL